MIRPDQLDDFSEGCLWARLAVTAPDPELKSYCEARAQRCFDAIGYKGITMKCDGCDERVDPEELEMCLDCGQMYCKSCQESYPACESDATGENVLRYCQFGHSTCEAGDDERRPRC